MSRELTTLEKEVMTMLLRGDDPALLVMQEQLQLAHVARREFSGVGFYTTLLVPYVAPRIPGIKTFSFGDVIAEIDGLQFGAGFLLHVEKGLLDLLEGYTYDEPWPVEIQGLKLSYVGGKRNLQSLREKWL